MDILNAQEGRSVGRFISAGAIVFFGRLLGCLGMAYAAIMLQGAGAVFGLDPDANCPVLAGQTSCEEEWFAWHYASPIWFLLAAVVAGFVAVTVLSITTPLARRVIGNSVGARGVAARVLLARLLLRSVALWAAFGVMWGIIMSGATTEWEFFEPWWASRASSAAYVPTFGVLLLAAILGGFLLRRGDEASPPAETGAQPRSTQWFQPGAPEAPRQ